MRTSTSIQTLAFRAWPATAAALAVLAGSARLGAAVIATTPTGPAQAGFVDEFGAGIIDEMVSGSIILATFGGDCRGYAEFDLSAVPDDAIVTSVRLDLWLSNHDNPGDPAVPLEMEVHGTSTSATAPPLTLHAAIGPLGGGNLYVKDSIDRTGVEFCADAFEKRSYDLGPKAVADVQASLGLDYITLGFVSSIVTDPLFDHLDYIGFTEEVMNPACTLTALPGSRITMLVAFDQPAPNCSPRNHGFWHRYCLGSGTIDPGRHGHGNGPDPSPQHDDLPAGLLASADAAMSPFGMSACQALDEGPFSDPRLAALREYATLQLNLAAGLLALDCPVELHPVDHRSGLVVRDAIAGMEARLLIDTVEALHEARWIGEHVANGEALLSP